MNDFGFKNSPLNAPVNQEATTREMIRQESRIAPFFLLSVTNVPPPKSQDGMIVFADGTNWNPGSGRGYYGKSSGVWVFLG